MEQDRVYTGVDEYIALFPANIQALLQELLAVVRRVDSCISS